jgi:hypothetical protein
MSNEADAISTRGYWTGFDSISTRGYIFIKEIIADFFKPVIKSLKPKLQIKWLT